ncbi:hypothetical protein [Spirosoma utsteinense]|uniref:Uncharacterized protein n=1 Tax=Spirosoma utsteinense TaxID=2585773 RepID=A0ABR6WAH7_9BACT|nr:hypothetical protein [Spirosoma utsteinense]MBC3787256.1 hypothetical protein [Spirosoma utsteinense]MBC3792942.1 hypothetical protein [Spirosoma utsteinense]
MATLVKRAFQVLLEKVQVYEQQRRDHRNTLRRDRYRAKKRAGGTTHPVLTKPEQTRKGRSI